MVKLKKILKSKRFWKTEMWLGGLLLGIPFFVSGKNFFEYLSSLTVQNILLMVIGTIGLGWLAESYFRPVLRGRC